jgi:hypothetical protein
MTLSNKYIFLALFVLCFALVSAKLQLRGAEEDTACGGEEEDPAGGNCRKKSAQFIQTKQAAAAADIWPRNPGMWYGAGPKGAHLENAPTSVKPTTVDDLCHTPDCITAPSDYKNIFPRQPGIYLPEHVTAKPAHKDKYDDLINFQPAAQGVTYWPRNPGLHHPNSIKPIHRGHLDDALHYQEILKKHGYANIGPGATTGAFQDAIDGKSDEEAAEEGAQE